jgi:hypothetical protein
MANHEVEFFQWVLGPDFTTKFQVLAKEKAYFRFFRWVLKLHSTRELNAYEEVSSWCSSFLRDFGQAKVI